MLPSSSVASTGQHAGVSSRVVKQSESLHVLMHNALHFVRDDHSTQVRLFSVISTSQKPYFAIFPKHVRSKPLCRNGWRFVRLADAQVFPFGPLVSGPGAAGIYFVHILRVRYRNWKTSSRHPINASLMCLGCLAYLERELMWARWKSLKQERALTYSWLNAVYKEREKIIWRPLKLGAKAPGSCFLCILLLRPNRECCFCKLSLCHAKSRDSSCRAPVLPDTCTHVIIAKFKNARSV